MSRLMCCPPWLAADLWPHVRKYAGAALDRTDLGLLSDLDTDVLSGRALLWVDDQAKCAVVTRIEQTQASKVCLICTVGGDVAKRQESLLFSIEEYAKAEGCNSIRWTGRRGWKRIFPEYREIGVVFERKLDG